MRTVAGAVASGVLSARRRRHLRAMSIGLAILAVVLFFAAPAGGVRGSESGRIVFASRLPAYPVPAGLPSVPQIFSVGLDGRGRRDLGASPVGALVSPDGRRIAFLRQGELWLMHSDGSGRRRLLVPPAGQAFREFEWSPDSDVLAAGSTQQVWLTRMDGSQQRQLLAAKPTEGFGAVSWSPDGAKLAIATRAGCELVVRLDGRRVAELGDCDSGGYVEPGSVSWSPLGKRIAYAEYVFDPKGDESILYVANSDGSAAMPASPDSPEPICWSGVAWSPDGRRLAFDGESCQGPSRPTVYVIDPDDLELERSFSRAMNPEWSPGSRLAFSRSVNGRDALFIASADAFIASAFPPYARRLTNLRVGDEEEPVWSSDGRRVAFTVGFSRLCVADLAGGISHQVVRERGLSISPLGWSRDGRRLLYTARRYRPFNLWSINPDGTSLTRLTANTVDDRAPAPSPDRSTIAFSRYDGIYTILADGSGEKLLSSTGYPSDPAWSPDGRAIVFDLFGSLKVMNADGTGEHMLTAGLAPAWSPDGTEIAFSNGGAIDVIRPDGTGLRTLLAGGPEGAPPDYTDPAWSPDGRQIAFVCAQDSCPQNGVFVMNADGSGVRLVVADRSPGSPSWAPDGASLVYQGAGTRSGSTLYRVDADGRNRVELTLFAADSVEPSWSR